MHKIKLDVITNTTDMFLVCMCICMYVCVCVCMCVCVHLCVYYDYKKLENAKTMSKWAENDAENTTKVENLNVNGYHSTFSPNFQFLTPLSPLVRPCLFYISPLSPYIRFSELPPPLSKKKFCHIYEFSNEKLESDKRENN